MSKKLTAYLILFCALGLTITAGYYSVVGLTIIFSGTFLPVLIFGSFLELSKVGITTYLHSYWKKIKWTIKTYLIIVITILSLITSLGIYGLLSSGFQSSILQTELNIIKINSIDSLLMENKEKIIQLNQEFNILNNNEQDLRKALIDKSTLQSYNKDGQLITKANSGSRKSFDEQLKNIKFNKGEIQNDIRILSNVSDSLDSVKMDIKIKDQSSTELTSLKNLSEFSGYGIKTIANIFIFILIFVFDPLAIILILSSNHAFKVLKEEYNKEEPVKEEPINEINNEVEEPVIEEELLEEINEVIENKTTEEENNNPQQDNSPGLKLEEVFKLIDGKSPKEKISIIDYVLNNYYLNNDDINILKSEKSTLLKKIV